MADSVFFNLATQGLLVTLVVQGLRALNLGRADEHPKLALLFVGAIVFAGNMIAQNLTADQIEFVRSAQPLIQTALALLIASGIFGYLKLILSRKGRTPTGAEAYEWARQIVPTVLLQLAALPRDRALTAAELDELIARLAEAFGTNPPAPTTPLPSQAPVHTMHERGGS